MGRGIKSNVLQRVKTNRQRIADAREREEREAAALRALSQPTKKAAEKPTKAA
jgi:hypothetical protein